MFNNSLITRLLRTTGAFISRLGMVAFLSFFMPGLSSAAGIKVVPSAPKVTPGESFYADVVVEGIPSDGLGAVQFRLNVSASGSTVAAVSDNSLGQPADVSVSSPLTIGPATTSRSGIGDFFWNAKGDHGILVMDNEALQNGSGLYTLGHTNGASLPSGSGSVARFQINAGRQVAAEKIVISLSDVVLLDGSTVYPLDSNTGATIDLKCYTQVPNFIGMSKTDATTALTNAKLSLGTVYEIDNSAGAYSLNTVLVQSANAGTTILCDTPVDLAINTPPAEVGNARALDKAGDESGIVVLSWLPSPSSDATGYRVYNPSGVRITDIANAASTGAEISGLASGVATQLRITAYDSHGNESPGVTISATALDDVSPRITVSGITDGSYYASDVLPVITVQDANLATKEITLNGAPYNQLAINAEGSYLLKVSAADSAGNASTKETRFTIDKTPPTIAVTGLAKGAYYNKDLNPVISVTDANLEKVESFLNGSPYTSGTVITAENNYELRIQALDKAGNSSSDTYPFFIDKTKPASTISIGLPKFESGTALYVAGATLFTLAGNDPGAVVSGVDRLEYRANSGLWGVYQAPVTLAGLNDGPVIMDYRAVDKATNIEDFHSVAVTLDSTPPVTTLSPGQPKYTDATGTTYVTLNTTFTLSASDALSGVALTEYKLDAGAWTPSAPFTVAAEGSHTILYHSKDNVGNPETDKSFNPVVDNTPPVTTITTGDPKYTAPDGKLYVTGVSTFTLSATDNLSGVAKTEYRIDNGAWTAYVPFTVTAEGTHTIDYRSQDNVTNLEAFKTLTLIVDNTPPVTTITTGDPQYAASDGKLYVTGSTTFTLSATDNLSGVSRTEYRIDGGQWTAYAPFTIAAEGTHAIDYYSKDNVTNTETFKTLTVIVDNTPPVSTITVGVPQYQADGKLYISGGTGITITATDALSGVKKTEYSIDGGDWNTYTAAFTLASYTDGRYTIRYRSIDNVTNMENAKELIVILDKTPPQTVISASDSLIDGVVNTVSPTTFFTLAATDALSGVRSITYRINNGSWQAYTGSFSLASMNEGQYAIAFKATDNVLNEETEKTITVRLIVIQVEKKIAVDSVVLVGFEGDKSDIDQEQADIRKLSSLLASLNVAYTVAQNADEFTSALRSGRYNTYILIDVKQPLIGEEVREAVHYGDGMIFIKTKPDADPFLDDLFGVKFSGKTTSDNLTVTLQSSPISAEGTLQTAGKSIVSRVTSTTAQVFGSVADKKDVYPAVIFNQYQQGKVLLYAFDLLNAPDQALASALMIESLNYVRPPEHAPRASDSVPLRITLKNSTEPVDVKLTETIPSGTTADTIIPKPVSAADNTFIWQKSLIANEKARFGYYLNLPDTAGDYLSKTELAYNNNGFFRPYGLYELLLTVQNSSDDLLQKIIAELRGAPVTSITDADLIAKAVDQLLLVNVHAATRKEAEDNIRYIVQAIDEVRKLSIDVAIRTELDELLKIWEKKWYRMDATK